MRTILKLLLVISLMLGSSCTSLQHRNSDDQADVVAMLLERANKSRDSIYIIDWKSNTDSKNNIKLDYEKNKILEIKNDVEEFDGFKNILIKQGINYDKELQYFKKQLKKPKPIDKSKIKLGNVRFFPSTTDPEKLFLDKNFKPINYYYDLPKIIFTRNGNNALIYQKNREYENHITLYKRIDGKWKAIIDFIDKPCSIE